MENLNPGMIDNFIPQEEPIPQVVSDMYKIEGYEGVNSEKYLRSNNLLETKAASHGQDSESQSLISKIKNEILGQDEEKIAISIMESLQSDDIEVQRLAASLIQHAPENQRESLGNEVHMKIVEALNNPSIEVQRIAVNMIQFAPECTRDSIKELVLQRIIEALNSNDVGKQKIMSKKISSAPEEAQEGLREVVYKKVVEALNGDDIRDQRMAATMVQYAPVDKQAELKAIVNKKYELAKQQGKANQVVESPLYTRFSRSDYSAFSREKLSKTGSETTLLLGEQFKNNLIIRHIEESCFLTWKKAYESHGKWGEAGFDYVPIEPIYSFSRNQHTNNIDVVSGVLDLNLEEWYLFSGECFKENLEIQKTRIQSVLAELGIVHGHPNNANFCLRFFRDENGNVNINETPRIYLIDFDKATMS